MQENQRLQEQLTSTPATIPLPQQPSQPAGNSLNQQVDKEMLSKCVKHIQAISFDHFR